MIQDVLYFGLALLMTIDMVSTFIGVRMGAKESNAFINSKIDSEKAILKMFILYGMTILFLIFGYTRRFESGIMWSYLYLYPVYIYVGYLNIKWIKNNRRK